MLICYRLACNRATWGLNRRTGHLWHGRFFSRAGGEPDAHEHLDEFVFRFNRRSSRSRGKLFYRLVQQAVAAEPTPYRSIVADWDNEPG